MPNARKIRWIAGLLLVAFTANFTVFCHCAAAVARLQCSAAARPHCCCEKKAPTGPCHGTQAVKFHLLEKQLADHVDLAPAPIILLAAVPISQRSIEIPTPVSPNCPKHPPPDLLLLQQRFLI